MIYCSDIDVSKLDQPESCCVSCHEAANRGLSYVMLKGYFKDGTFFKVCCGMYKNLKRLGAV